MDPIREYGRTLTRRRFFARAATGGAGALGAAALWSVLGDDARAAAPAGSAPEVPAALRVASAAVRVPGPHFAPKAKRVICLHMEGAPSQLDLYDYKPGLAERFDQELPASIRNGQRLTGMTSGQTRFPVAPSMFKFALHKNRADGLWLSELLPQLGTVASELCVVRSMHTDAINHEPAITFFQTGNQQPGRPSFGAWTSYGLGSANANLPSFVVLIAQGFGNMQALSARFWGSAFLPSEHQGCRLRGGASPVLYLQDPDGVTRQDRRAFLDAVAALNAREEARTLDPEIAARVAQAELAYRMQAAAPEFADLASEDASTFELYGEEAKKPGTFAANCLLARRLAERGVRFVQLYFRGWDQHGNLPHELRLQCKAFDRPAAALIKDLKRRGLLDDTLVLWSGEFGRTVYSQGTLTRTNYGRDHHPRAFTVWMAGGGVKPGIVYGATDDYGYNVVEKPVSVHDLHATLLHQLGFDHERLTYRSEGRDFRLTDVAGTVVRDLLA
jgi:uncharacterized protein (DUF1501 family)